MNKHSGLTRSIWMQTAEIAPPPALKSNIGAEVCIVGAGMAGLSTAYLLAKEGKSVIVIDDGPLSGGETERTTAHLSNAMDDRYYFLEKHHGTEGIQVLAQSHGAAIDHIDQTARTEGIDCDFARLDGYLFVPPGASADELNEELAAAHRAGLSQVELVARAPLEFWDTGPVLRFPNQGQFHPLKYLKGLIAAIQRYGGRVFSNTRATDFDEDSQVTVTTEGGNRISCGSLVVATNTPVNDRVKIHTKQAPYRTYVIGAAVPAGSVPLGLYWDTAQDAELAASNDVSAPYHYVRLQRVTAGTERDILIVGGEDHKTGQASDVNERWARLEAWTRERFPMVQGVEMKWSGQVMEPADGVAFIGRNAGGSDNVFIATGDSGQGMTHGAIAGMLLRDLITGRPNPWSKLYDPSRQAATKEYIKENANVAARYREFVTAGELSSEDELQPGHGAIIRRGLKKVAVHRDEQGQLHANSAVCPHMGCIVHWNPAEKSWDCPCHGSRFAPDGETVNGPAIDGLHPVEPSRSK